MNANLDFTDYVSIALADGFSLEDVYWVKDHKFNVTPERFFQIAHEELGKGVTLEQFKEDNQIPSESDPEEFGGRKAKCAADVEDEVHRYLWKPYVPLEDYTVLMAASGTGKTFVCCWLASQVTKGGFFPADTDFYAQDEAKRTGSTPKPGNVVYISSEENAGELRHRFSEAGGDLSRFFIFDREDSAGMNFTTGFDDFLICVNQYHPKLVIIDPWQSFIGTEIDTNKVNHVRPAMQKLAIIAKRCECAVILVSHVNKKPQAENINNAAIGSTEFVNAARSALRVVADEEEQDARILVHTKANYSAAGDSLKFHITHTGGFVYDGISLVTRSVLETAARNRKTVAEVMAQRIDDQKAKETLIEKIRELADPIKPGGSTIIAFEEMQDYYGDDIFNGYPRPGAFIKKVMMTLEKYGIEIRLTTGTGIAKKATYKGKKKNGFEIYKKI